MSKKKSKDQAVLEETNQTQRGQNRGQRKPKVQPGEKKQTDEKIVQSDPRNGRRATNRDITERKRAEDALQQSEERFRILFDEALDGICLADAETGFIIDCNQALAALVGRERAELIGQPQKTLHPSQNDKAAYSPTFRQHLNDKEGQTLETQVVTSTGIIRDVEIKANRLNLQGREMLQGIFHDITERKRTEAERQALLEIMQGVAATESLQELLELIRQSLAKVIYAENFFVVFHNRSTGLFEEVFAVDKYDAPMPPSKLERSITSYVFRTGEPLLLTEAKFEELMARGEVELVGTKQAIWLGAPLKTPSKTIGVIAVQNYEDPNCYSERDREFIASVGAQVALAIERKRAEEALRESEERFRALTENATDLIIVLNPDGTGKYVSPSVERILGFNADEMVGTSIADFIHPDDLSAALEAVAYRQQTPGLADRTSEFRVRHKDGSYRMMEVIGNNLMDNPAVNGIVVNARDITERKRAEEALRESESSLREAQALGQVGNWEHNLESQKITWSDQVYRLYERDPVLGPPTVEEEAAYYSPEQVQMLHEYARRAVEEGQDFEYDLEATLPSGKRVYFSAKMQPVKDASGRIVKLFGTVQDITERKQVEEELRESEERFRSILDNIEDGYYEVDTAGNLTFFNPAHVRILGRPANELMGMNNRLYMTPEGAKAVFQTFNRVFRTGIPEQAFNWELVRPDGTRRSVETSVSLIKEADGSINGFRGIVHDITERKQAEEKLAASEAELRALFAAMTDVVIVYDADGRYIKIAPTMTTNLLWSPDELLGKTMSELLPPDQATFFIDHIKQTLKTGQLTSVEYNLRIGEKDIWYAALISPLSANSVIWVARDITERKRAEEKLEEERILLRTLIDNLPDRVYVMDVQGRKIISNIADWQASGGKTMGDVIGKTDLDTYPPELAEEYWALDKTVIDSGISIINREEPGLDSKGNPVWVLSSKVALRDGQGKVVGLVGIGRDITERKQAEEQILRQVETLGALYDLSRTLSEIEDFNAILDLVTRRAVESAHVTFARVLLLEQDDLVVRAAFPVRVLDHDLQVGQREPLAAHPICQRILDENAPLVLQADSPEAGDCAPFFLGIAQTLCIVPLHVREQPFGLLMLGEARAAAREPFTMDKIRLACSISDQAASTLHRALLHEETERRLQRITALRTIDSTIAASMDIRMTLSILLEQVTSQLKVDAASVLLLNPHMQTLEYAAGRGFRTEALQRTHLRLGEGYAGRAALERKLVHIPDLRGRKTDFLRSPYFLAEDFVAYYGVPLIAKGQVKGVLEVFHRLPLASEPDWVSFLETLAGQAAIAIDNTQLFDNLQRSNADLSVAYDATIEGWSAALDLRDKETEGHSLRVTEMTLQLARSLGIGEAELVHVRRGALLHDIGKMGVPDSILLKPDKLSDEEWAIMRRHPKFVFDMLSPITYLRPALDIPYCHHEKWDGTGYPRGLKGEEIPLSARIFAVVDVYDALTSDRPYRKAWTREKTISHIGEQAGCHFDPEVVKVFLKELANEE